MPIKFNIVQLKFLGSLVCILFLVNENDVLFQHAEIIYIMYTSILNSHNLLEKFHFISFQMRRY